MKSAEIADRIKAVVLVFLFLATLSFAATDRYITTLDMRATTDIEAADRVNIAIQLERTEVTTGVDSTALSEATETGKVSVEDVRRSYTTHHVEGQEVVVKFVRKGVEETLCTLTTDANGEASCTKILTASDCGLVVASFAGTETLAKSTAIPFNHCSTTVPPFTEIVGPEWLMLFLFIGLLAAGLYASGRRPGSAFDVTTPKLKGAISDKPKTKIRTTLGGSFKAAYRLGGVVPVVSAALISRRNKKQLSTNLEEAKRAIEKHGTPEMKTKIKRAKMVSTDNMVKLVSSMMIGGGLYTNMKKKLAEKQKRLKELERLKMEVTGTKALKVETELSDLEKTIQSYKQDLMALSPTSLMPGENFAEVVPESYGEIGESLKASFVGLIFGQKGVLKEADTHEGVDEQVAQHVDAIDVGHPGETARDYPSLRKGLLEVLAAKAEIQRVRLAVCERAILKLKQKQVDKTKKYKEIFKKKEPLSEAGRDLLDLMKKLDEKEYQSLLKILKDVDAADLTMANTEKKFIKALEKIRSLNETITKGMEKGMIERNLEKFREELAEAIEDAGMAYLILKKRAKGYKEAIEKEVDREKLPLKVRAEDVPEFGDLLVNDAFSEKGENRKETVNVLIDSYIGQVVAPGGEVLAESHLVDKGNEVVYEKGDKKVTTIDMLEDLKRSVQRGRSYKSETEVTGIDTDSLSGQMPMRIARKLDKIIRQIRDKKQTEE